MWLTDAPYLVFCYNVCYIGQPCGLPLGAFKSPEALKQWFQDTARACGPQQQSLSAVSPWLKLQYHKYYFRMCLLVGFLHEFNIFLFKNTIFGSLIVVCVWDYIFDRENAQKSRPEVSRIKLKSFQMRATLVILPTKPCKVKA